MNFLAIILSALMLVPKPSEQTPVLKGDRQLVITMNPANIRVHSRESSFDPLVQTWAEFMEGAAQQKVKIGTTRFKIMADVVLAKNASLADEEYILDMGSGSSVRIEASSARGAWWGIQSLTQMIVAALDGSDESAVNIPAWVIRDKPRFGYRGAHLDCSRHFFTVDQVKRFIDMMCVHKLNVFHWHLTDDQGWRIEIRKYPLLAEIGSVRKETLVGHARVRPQTFDGTEYGRGMYYTQDQIREVVAYAAARQIDIMPEIEMPGHMVAALSAYPSYGCTGGPYEVWTKWGVSQDVLCLGKESSYKFISDILDEVCQLFPYKYVHIGGDEAPVVKRKTCPHCQAKMKQLGYKKEVQLQGYLISRVEKMLKARGKELVGWNEILDAGVSPQSVIMSWQGDGKSGIRATQQGNKVIMTPGSNFYFDYYQTTDPQANEEPLAFGGCVTLEKVYSYNPFTGLDEQQQEHILGVQANTWTEYMADFNQVQHMDLPRFSSLSEVGWTMERDTFDQFKLRVSASMLPVYKYFGFNYAKYEFK